jgi:glycosyltransferase involved in cell wall biosynthesis
VKRLFLSVTHAAHSDARTGIQTTVRGLVGGLERQIGSNLRLVTWSHRYGAFTSLPGRRREHLGATHAEPAFLPLRSLAHPTHRRLWFQTAGRAHRAPLHLHPEQQHKLEGNWLVLPEVMYHGVAPASIVYARQRGMRVAAIFHDAIPLTHPQFVRAEAVEYHREYLGALCSADVVFAVSQNAAEAFAAQARACGFSIPALHAHLEPAEIIGHLRTGVRSARGVGPVKILCVSTLEPRKNHATLIAAFDVLCATHPTLNVQLDLVGDTYAGSPDLAEMVQSASRRNARICWHGKVSPEKLIEHYRACDFTVYPSILEGFGLPIGESLWLGRPCICADFGAMVEVASGGGCLTVDVREPQSLTTAMLALATDESLRHRLAQEAMERKLRTWSDYARGLCEFLRTRQE